MKDLLKNMRQHLMTGVSYMIPFVVSGGVLLAIAVMISGQAAVPETGLLKAISDIGIAGLTLFIPILGGYIAYSMAEKPGIAPGAIGAYLANTMGAGFLGGMIAGIIAGIVVHYLKQIKVPDVLRTVLYVFIIPLCGTLITGLIVIYLIGDPVAYLLTVLNDWLSGMQSSSKILLGIILGCMITFDMGGPLNKTAFFFAVAMIDTQPTLMAAVAVAVCTPPLGLGLASVLFKKSFLPEEQEAGKAALVMGCIGISEGAIPFAAGDPLRVIPSIMIGGAAGATSSLFFSATSTVPWGGMIVLPVVGNPVGFFISILIGTAVTALTVKILKSTNFISKDKADEKEVELDIDFD